MKITQAPVALPRFQGGVAVLTLAFVHPGRPHVQTDSAAGRYRRRTVLADPRRDPHRVGSDETASRHRRHSDHHFIYAENRSFDNLYGSFPGANGLRNAKNATQLDRDGTV